MFSITPGAGESRRASIKQPFFSFEGALLMSQQEYPTGCFSFLLTGSTGTSATYSPLITPRASR